MELIKGHGASGAGVIADGASVIPRAAVHIARNKVVMRRAIGDRFVMLLRAKLRALTLS
jgi:hypothetical protein